MTRLQFGQRDNFESDPANYLEQSKPFTNAAEAEKAMNDFYQQVRALRNQYHIADVHIIFRVNVMVDGKPKSVISNGAMGDYSITEELCAWSIGQFRRERNQRIKQLIGDEEKEEE